MLNFEKSRAFFLLILDTSITVSQIFIIMIFINFNVTFFALKNLIAI
jgi:hypothetical protein